MIFLLTFFRGSKNPSCSLKKSKTILSFCGVTTYLVPHGEPIGSGPVEYHMENQLHVENGYP